MGKGIVFLALAATIFYVSRKSLRVPGSHGFYRFFAWEIILILVFLNLDAWFRDPFSWYQWISWFLLVLCVGPLIIGVRSLARQGKPTSRRDTEPQLLAFEKTTALVTTGIYRYIRHPLYSSLLLLGWGVFFKIPTWYGALMASAATGFLFATAKADERECVRFFGADYESYMKRSKRFIPFIF
jgi:protein-S-isoprenylcysteine O-methyltransferase Ste14